MSFTLHVIEDGGSGFGIWPADPPFRVVPNANVIIKTRGLVFSGKTNNSGIVYFSDIDFSVPVSVEVQKSGYKKGGFQARLVNDMWIKITRSGVSVIPILAIAAIALFIISRKR